MACRTSRKRPPSEKESSVRLTIPTSCTMKAASYQTAASPSKVASQRSSAGEGLFASLDGDDRPPHYLPAALLSDEDKEISTAFAPGPALHFPGDVVDVGGDRGGSPNIYRDVALGVVEQLRRGHELSIGVDASSPTFDAACEARLHEDDALVEDVLELIESLFVPGRGQPREHALDLALVGALGLHSHGCLRTEAYHSGQEQDSRRASPLYAEGQRRVEEGLFENTVEGIRRNQHCSESPDIRGRPSQPAL